MKILKTKNKSAPLSEAFLLSPSQSTQARAKRKLAGFAKVLSGGRVVRLDKDKPFRERMIGSIPEMPAQTHSPHYQQAILQTVEMNLTAGLRLLDEQELCLAKIGGKLSEVALSLNNAQSKPDTAACEHERFEKARARIRDVSKTTFDHCTLFSNGPSNPIIVAVPTPYYWEGLSIERCDISQPGFISIDKGKVSPHAEGLMLDGQSISRSFTEWRRMCASNRMQWQLLKERMALIVRSMSLIASGKDWALPQFPEDSSTGPLQRPHKLN